MIIVSIVKIWLFAIVVIFLVIGLPVLGSYKKSVLAAPVVEMKPIAAVISAEQRKIELPLRLKIPKIKVNAVIESVGFAKDGSVGVPKLFNNVAWFNLSARPGDKGSAIIDGHYGWRNGKPGVFNNLNKLLVGDTLSIEDKKGNKTKFIVREIRTYAQNDDASFVFTASDDKEHLNLVTCFGVWNKKTQQYSKRLVVFTDKVN